MKHCPKILNCLLIFSLCFWINIFSSIQPVHAQSGTLYNLSDTINDDTPSQSNVDHSVTFTLPGTAQQITSTDYIHITLTNFYFVQPANRVVGTYTGTPTYSVSGKTARVTGINVLPTKTITIEGITAQNPTPSDQFGILVTVTEDEAGLLVKNTASAVAKKHSLSVRVSATVDNPQARLDIEGYGSPEIYVVFSEGESIMGTQIANPAGYFAKIFSALPPGDHTINFYGIDSDNRSTSIRSIDINTPVYLTTTVSNQLLSPTIEINSSSLEQTDALHATGSAYPGSTITVFTDAPIRTYSASASAQGDWTYSIASMSAYNPGDYRIYALAQASGGLQSLISPTILFTITSDAGGGSTGSACDSDISDGDINCDGTVDLTDFSILMYYWATTNAEADINQNGLVDLTDFSIMMYYWGS